jgi:N-acetylneuraminic acid mutarotase
MDATRPTRSAQPRPLPADRAALVVCAIVACLGGQALAAGSWDPLPPLEQARQEVAGAYLNGALYVVGGFGAAGETLASAERWREGAAAWEPLPPMPVAVNHPAAAAIDGRLIVIGGFRGPGLQNATDAVQVFDPDAGSWRLAAPMPSARGGLAAAVLGDRVIAVGGARDGVSLGDVAAYDPAADSWTELTPLPTPRDHLGVAVLDGRLHAVGGRTGRSDFTLRTHEVYDPTDNTWADAAPMPTGRSGHAVAALDGCLYALGGEGNPSRRDGMFEEVERFHPATGAWEALAPMASPRHGMAAVPVDGRLLVPGGATVAGFGAVRIADAFTPPPCRG